MFTIISYSFINVRCFSPLTCMLWWMTFWYVIWKLHNLSHNKKERGTLWWGWGSETTEGYTSILQICYRYVSMIITYFLNVFFSTWKCLYKYREIRYIFFNCTKSKNFVSEKKISFTHALIDNSNQQKAMKLIMKHEMTWNFIFMSSLLIHFSH